MPADHPTPFTPPERSLGSVMTELSESLGTIMRSEAHLIKAEVKEAAHLLSTHGTQIVIFGGIGLLGALPLVAFLVIGLGRAMGGSGNDYMFSSLAVGIILSALGIAGTLRAIRHMKKEDFSFPHVRESLGSQKDILNRKLHEVYDAIQRRAS